MVIIHYYLSKKTLLYSNSPAFLQKLTYHHAYLIFHYITITGKVHYLGDVFLKEGTRVTLNKDPDNKYDHEAIRVEMEGLGKIGYVANSTYTVLGDCFSAGCLYDRIDNKAIAKVRHILPKGVICSMRKRDLIWTPPQKHDEENTVST